MLNYPCAGTLSNRTERWPRSTVVDGNLEHTSLIFRNSRKMRTLQKQVDVCYSHVWYELLQVKSRKRIHKLQGVNHLMCRISKWVFLFHFKCCLPTALSSEASKYCQRQNCWVKHSMCSAPVTELVCYQPPPLSRVGYHFQKRLE